MLSWNLFFLTNRIKIEKDWKRIPMSCKNVYMVENEQKSRFILEEIFRIVIELKIIYCSTIISWNLFFLTNRGKIEKEFLRIVKNVYMAENEQKSRFILEKMFRIIIELKIIDDILFYYYIVKPLFPNKSRKDWKRISTNCKNVYMMENEQKSRFILEENV